MSAQCASAAGTDGPPRFGLGRAQCVGAKEGPVVLLLHSGEGRLHLRPGSEGCWDVMLPRPVHDKHEISEVNSEISHYHAP